MDRKNRDLRDSINQVYNCLQTSWFLTPCFDRICIEYGENLPLEPILKVLGRALIYFLNFQNAALTTKYRRTGGRLITIQLATMVAKLK